MALGLGSAAIDAAIVGDLLRNRPARNRASGRSRLRHRPAYESDVLDESPPVIMFPAGVFANATGPDGAAVSYSASAVDGVDGPVAVVCVPPPEATFAIGTTDGHL